MWIFSIFFFLGDGGGNGSFGGGLVVLRVLGNVGGFVFTWGFLGGFGGGEGVGIGVVVIWYI